jgi:hypothetical protein
MATQSHSSHLNLILLVCSMLRSRFGGMGLCGHFWDSSYRPTSDCRFSTYTSRISSFSVHISKYRDELPHLDINQCATGRMISPTTLLLPGNLARFVFVYSGDGFFAVIRPNLLDALYSYFYSRVTWRPCVVGGAPNNGNLPTMSLIRSSRWWVVLSSQTPHPSDDDMELPFYCLGLHRRSLPHVTLNTTLLFRPACLRETRLILVSYTPPEALGSYLCPASAGSFKGGPTWGTAKGHTSDLSDCTFPPIESEGEQQDSLWLCRDKCEASRSRGCVGWPQSWGLLELAISYVVRNIWSCLRLAISHISIECAV